MREREQRRESQGTGTGKEGRKEGGERFDIPPGPGSG